MITLRVMESSADYNNHHVTVKEDGGILIDAFLIDFNNTDLAHKLEKLCLNKVGDSIEALDCYGYKGELENSDIVKDLIEFKEKK